MNDAGSRFGTVRFVEQAEHWTAKPAAAWSMTRCCPQLSQLKRISIPIRLRSEEIPLQQVPERVRPLPSPIFRLSFRFGPQPEDLEHGPGASVLVPRRLGAERSRSFRPGGTPEHSPAFQRRAMLGPTRVPKGRPRAGKLIGGVRPRRAHSGVLLPIARRKNHRPRVAISAVPSRHVVERLTNHRGALRQIRQLFA